MQSVNEKYKLGLYFSVFSASLGGFCSGTILGWSSAVPYIPTSNTKLIENHLPLAASMAPLGALVFALPAKKLADSIGRTPTMLFAMVLFLLSWIMLAFGPYKEVLIAGRFIGGMGMGASWLVSQVYIMEISSDGFLVLFKVFVSLGLLFVNCLQLFTGWQEYHLLPGLFPILFALCFLNLPESPLYYSKKGKTNKASKSLRFLGLKEVKQSNNKINYLDKSIIICFGLAIYQQLTNIAGIHFFLKPIINNSLCILIIIIYSLNILSQLVSIRFLGKSQRKLLLLISTIFIALAHFCLGLFYQLLYCNIEFYLMEYIPAILICVILIAYSIGFGPVPDLILKDLFGSMNNNLFGLMNITRWLVGFLVTFFYSTSMDNFNEYDKFYVFGIIMTTGIVFVAFFVPETYKIVM